MLRFIQANSVIHFRIQTKMGNKNGTYDALSDETKVLLMQRTGKQLFIIIFTFIIYSNIQ